MGCSKRLLILILGAIIGAVLFWYQVHELLPYDFSNHANKGWYPFFKIVVFYPVLEEYVFRGLIWEYLEKLDFLDKKLSVVMIVIVSSAIFCMAHMIFRDISALPILFAGIYLGIIRSNATTILPVIGVHCFWNFGWYLYF